jgi:hypothetical protein
MDNKKIKKPRKQRDKKTKNKNKNKNKNTQSIKINISSSGGLGGSGGGTPSSIPIPVQSFARSEKIGENVEVSNLLKRIENQQQNVFTNLMNQQQTAFNNLMTQRPEEINRDDKIDEAERINKNDIVEQAENINNGIDGDDKYIFSTSMLSPSSSPFIQPNPDNSNLSLMQRLGKEIKDVGRGVLGGGGGGGGGGVSDGGEIGEIDPDITINNLKNNKQSYTFKQKSISIGTFNTKQEAEDARREYYKFFSTGKPDKQEIRNYAYYLKNK